MRSKLLIFSALATLGVVALLAVGVTAFVLFGSETVQAEEAIIQEVAPIEIEAETVVQPEVVKPVLDVERAGYAGHEGGCPFSSEAKMQLTEKAPAESEVVGENLLTLAE